jgi:hypothetical protein
MEGGATLSASRCYYLTEKRGTRRSARTRHFDSSLYVITPGFVGNPEVRRSLPGSPPLGTNLLKSLAGSYNIARRKLIGAA